MLAPLSIILFKDSQQTLYYRAFSPNNPHTMVERLVEQVYMYLGLVPHGIEDQFHLSNDNTLYFLREIITRPSDLSEEERDQGFWIALKPNGALASDCTYSVTEQTLRDQNEFQENYITKFINHIYV